MELEHTWTFEQYRAYESGRVGQSALEQQVALSEGLIADPKTAPHGGYRVACTWSEEITVQARDLSVRLAARIPGAPAYPSDSIHSSIGNLRPAEDRLIEPDHLPEDRQVLDRLCDVVTEAARSWSLGDGDDACTVFGPGYLAPRMAYVFGRPGVGYWRLYQAVHAASGRAGIELVGSWGPHLTLTRFGQSAGPKVASEAVSALASWRTRTSAPVSIAVGYYKVADGGFRVTTYRSFPVG